MWFFIMPQRLREALEVTAGRRRGCLTKAKAVIAVPMWTDIGMDELIRVLDVLPDHAFTPWPTCFEVNRVRYEFNVAPMELCDYCAEIAETQGDIT